MKIKVLGAIALLTTLSLYSQVGIGTEAPHSSSILDIESTTKGFFSLDYLWYKEVLFKIQQKA